MSNTAINLCTRALVKIGASGISGFDDGTAEAEVAAAFYEPTRDALLSANDWSFAIKKARLAMLADPPAADYQNAFQLPSDFIRAISAGVDGRTRGLEYEIVGDTLNASSDSVVLTYVSRPDESIFPPFFTQALVSRLAAEFCIPLTESTSRAEMLHTIAEKEFRRARIIDTQQDVQPRFEDFSLIEARRGG